MTHAILAAKSGWGKSWLTQWWVEDNVPEYDHLVVLDYKDEYRGLVKAGLASWGIAGPGEAAVSAEGWMDVMEENPQLVLARHRLSASDWRELCAEVILAARNLDGSVLIVVDEAHFVAPQSKGVPEAIQGLATTGRGEGVSSMWVTQRLAMLEEDIIGNVMVCFLGGFTSSADLDKVGKVVDYPKEIHNPQVTRVPHLPDELDTDDGAPVRKFTEDGATVGSEWVYSTDAGDVKRVDSRDLAMDSTHYGPEGNSLTTPG